MLIFLLWAVALLVLSGLVLWLLNKAWRNDNLHGLHRVPLAVLFFMSLPSAVVAMFFIGGYTEAMEFLEALTDDLRRMWNGERL